MSDADCEVPTLGRTWHPFPPVVYLPMWEVAPDPGPLAPFTSVTQWTWEEVWLDKRVLSMSKRDAYCRHVDLPRRAGRPFELAANIHWTTTGRSRAYGPPFLQSAKLTGGRRTQRQLQIAYRCTLLSNGLRQGRSLMNAGAWA